MDKNEGVFLKLSLKKGSAIMERGSGTSGPGD